MRKKTFHSPSYLMLFLFTFSSIKSMHNEWNSNTIKEAVALKNDSSISPALAHIFTLSFNKKCEFLEECLNDAVKTDNNDPKALCPLFDRIIGNRLESPHYLVDGRRGVQKKSCLLLIARDAVLFNYAIFKGSLSLKNSATAFCKLRTLISRSTAPLTNDIIILWLLQSGFRINGKTFIDLTFDKSLHTHDQKKNYWKAALMPTIFPERFQQANPEKNNNFTPKKSFWTITDLHDRTIYFLKCLHRFKKEHRLIIPKVVVNNCILPFIFSDPLEVIKNHFDTIQNYIEINNNHYYEELIRQNHDESPIMANNSLLQEEYFNKYDDSTQREFFKQFNSWYSAKVHKLFDNRFAIVQQLIAYNLQCKK